MSALLFALVGSFLAAVGARDQLLVAHLRGSLGPARGLLAIAIVCASITACIAAWAGSMLSGSLSEDSATMLVALAMLLCGCELAWPNKPPELAEPTRSLGAIAIVLLARQLTDASRFLIAAVAVALPSPELAAVGGAMGGGAALALGWGLRGEFERLPLRALRRVLAGIMLTLGVLIGLAARGVIW